MSRRRRHRRLIVFSDQYNCKPAACDQPPVDTGTVTESGAVTHFRVRAPQWLGWRALVVAGDGQAPYGVSG
jgi:hypothetical protein